MNGFEQQQQQATVNAEWAARAAAVQAEAGKSHQLAMVNGALRRRVAAADEKTKNKFLQGGLTGAGLAAAVGLTLWILSKWGRR